MKKYSQEEISSTLSQLTAEPSTEWVNQTLGILEDLPDSKASTIDRFKNIFRRRAYFSSFLPLRSGFLLKASALTISGLFLLGLMYTSRNNILPGEALYTLDQFSEEVQRVFIRDEDSKIKYDLEILEERIKEYRILNEQIYEDTSQLLDEINIEREKIENDLNKKRAIEKEKEWADLVEDCKSQSANKTDFISRQIYIFCERAEQKEIKGVYNSRSEKEEVERTTDKTNEGNERPDNSQNH